MIFLSIIIAQAEEPVRLDTAYIVMAIENAKEKEVELPEFEDCFNSKEMQIGNYKFEINPYGVFTVYDGRGNEILTAPVNNGRCNGWQIRVRVYDLGDVVVMYMNRNLYFIYPTKRGASYKILRMDIPISRYKMVPAIGISIEGNKIKIIGGTLKSDRYFYGYMYIYDRAKRKINSEPIPIASSIQFSHSRQL